MPPKCVSFVWRVAKECIPTRANLDHHHIPITNSMCQVCHSDSETILHVLVQCPYAKDVWCRSRFGVFVMNGDSFMDWLQTMFNIVRQESWSRLAVILWFLWRHKNNCVWKDKSIAAQVLMV